MLIAIAIIASFLAGVAFDRWLAARLVLLVCIGRESYAQTPYADVEAARADAEKLGASALQARYLSLSGVRTDFDHQADPLIAVNYCVNAVSRVRQISRVTQVTPTLLRIDVSNYVRTSEEFAQWTAQWNKLTDADFYFNLPHEEIQGGKVVTVSVAGGWLPLPADASLRNLTGTLPHGAVLRADAFVSATLSPAAYYQFAGIGKTQTEFQKSLGLDQSIINQLEADLGANLVVSAFTLKPRRIAFSQGPLGGYWVTLDTKQADARHDPVRRPITVDKFATLFDASEVFGMQKNGFWAVAVFDNQGNRLDAVDPNIANDTAAKDDNLPQQQVLAGASCYRCHTAESGLNSFTDAEQSLLHTKRGQAFLSSYDPALIRRTLEFYDDPRLQRQVKFDRETHELAVARACGCTTIQAAAALRSVLKTYQEAVTPEAVAQELGVSSKELPLVIDGTTDEILASLGEGNAVARGSYEPSVPELFGKLIQYRNAHPVLEGHKP
jgi:hypothetical protein